MNDQQDGVWTSEQVITCQDDTVGLRAVIAVDDTTLGPGFGGVRFKAYPSTAAAVEEAQRLAAAMTLKHALAELPYGGAKSVIIDDGLHRDGSDRQALVARFGSFVARLGGLYIPGVDMGTTLADMTLIAQQGAKVYCAEHDPAPWTARGTYVALQAGAAPVYGSHDSHDSQSSDGANAVAGLRVSVQGVGSVGAALARLLAAAGAHLIVSDVDSGRARQVAAEVGGEVVDPAQAPFVDCDVFAPCAVSRVITTDGVERLRCRVVAGAANDPLDSPEVAEALRRRGVTVVPDYVANAGGVIHEHARAMGWPEAQLEDAVDAIGPRVAEILRAADQAQEPPLVTAARRGRDRLRQSGSRGS